jgi:hypothetical protein
MKLEFSQETWEKNYNIKFHDNPLGGAEFFHEDRRTDMTKLIVAFRNFAKAPKKEKIKQTV